MNRIAATLLCATALCSSAVASADEVIIGADPAPSSGKEAPQEAGGYISTTSRRYPNYLGVGAGVVSGYGLSYRRWIGNTWGFTINLLPLYIQEKYPDDSDGSGGWYHSDGYYYTKRDSGYLDRGTLSLGLTLLRSFAEMKTVRILGYAGGNMHVDYRNADYYVTTSEWNSEHQRTEPVVKRHREQRNNQTLTVGAGAGVEIFVWRFAFNLMAGLAGGQSPQKETAFVMPAAEAGMYFRF